MCEWEKEPQVCVRQEHHYNHQLRTLLESGVPPIPSLADCLLDVRPAVSRLGLAGVEEVDNEVENFEAVSWT